MNGMNTLKLNVSLNITKRRRDTTIVKSLKLCQNESNYFNLFNTEIM